MTVTFRRRFATGILFGVCALVLTTVESRGQSEDYIRLAMAHSQSRIYHDAYVLPGPGDSALVVVQFRLPFDRLVFMRHRDGLDEQAYRASVEVTIELFEGNEVVEEKIWRDEAFAAEYDQTMDRTLSLTGRQTFILPPGRYAYRLRLADLNTELAGTSMLRRVVVPGIDDDVQVKALLASSVEWKSDTLVITPTNLGGDSRLGAQAFAVVPLWRGLVAEPEGVDVRYTVRRLDRTKVRKERERAARSLRNQPRQRGDSPPRPRMEPEFSLQGGEIVASGDVPSSTVFSVARFRTVDVGVGLITAFADSSDSGKRLVAINLDGQGLEAATYVVDVFLGSADRPVSSTRFATHWPNMPVSLHNMDVAIRNLEFLIGRKAASAMRRGSSTEKEDKFLTFWRDRDPTPETVINELMEEYYRRIDHAAFEFRTGSGGVPNGLKTDRARVYIAQGPPDSTTRSFPESGGVIEVWSYNDGREFTFESQSSAGEFRKVSEKRNL